MSTDSKPSAPTSATPPHIKHREKGIRIFTWPKMIYIFPSAIVALICSLGMWSLREREFYPTKETPAVTTDAPGSGQAAPARQQMTKLERFRHPQNLLGMLFLAVLAFNLLVMALDFPRFELVGVILLILFTLFFILWLGAYFQLDLMRPLHALFESVYVFANAGFYLMYFLVVLVLLLIVYVTRWLDYWEVMPNEILHHHGPLSDLERFPTMNLKFDKEIPDVLEFALLGAGKLVLHVPNVEKALVLENVLFINTKEQALKTLMSRLEVRVTSDQEVGDRET
jgi:magnesium-transporting ATPase (P-type)